MSTDTVDPNAAEAATPAEPEVQQPAESIAPVEVAPVEEEMDMGALLDSEASQPGQLRRGEIVEGVVMGASSDGMLVDVGIKTEAIIPQGEMLSLGVEGGQKLNAGDVVKVMVLQPMTSEGHALVSLDRARGEEGWDVLQARFEAGDIFEAQVTGHNRGGILVNIEGVNAFVPLSQIDSVRRDSPEAVAELSNLVGTSIRLKVLELNRKRNRVILSERAAMAEFRKEQKDRILDQLQEGEIRTGVVSSITDFGVFVDLGGADGLAHMTELTWERGKKARDLYTVGDEVQAYILKVDRETKKISLSLKRAQPERWDEIVDRYVIGQVLIGRVTKLMAFGAFVRLDGPVEGLIHISELSNRRIQHPKDVVKEGDVVPVKLVRIERDRNRLGLSLRQARSDAEAMGFAFDQNGAVIDYPDDVRSQFELPPRDESAPRPKPSPRTAQEAIEQAVARDPEPVSAFAHAFAQALENAEGDVEGFEGAPPPTPEASVEAATEAAPEASVEAAPEAPSETEPEPEASAVDAAPATAEAATGDTEEAVAETGDAEVTESTSEESNETAAEAVNSVEAAEDAEAEEDPKPSDDSSEEDNAANSA